MNAAPTPPAGSPLARALARKTLALYPAAWRARYGDEVRALLDVTGADLRTIASLVWQAMPAWIWPARQLYDRPARMRASLGTVLMAWTALTGLALVFAQLTELQGFLVPHHPIIDWSYGVFDVAILASGLAVAVGGLPVWLRMMRDSYADHRRRELAYLLSPVVVPAGYLAAVIVTARLVRHVGAVQVSPGPHAVIDLANGGVGPWWFLALAVLGLAAGAVSAAGPILALRRLRPDGTAVRRATRAAGLAAVSMGLAAAASMVAAIGLYLWAPQYAGYHQGWPLGIYLPAVLLAVAVAMVSAVRGVRSARSPAAA